MSFRFIWSSAVAAVMALGRFAAAESPGYTYQHDTVSEVPWSIHILKVDRSNHDLQLHTVAAQGTTFGLNSLPEQVKLIPAEIGKPIAAINGDFYNKDSQYSGDPKGIQIMRGELLSAPNDWSCIWVSENQDLSLGKLTSLFSVTLPDGTSSKLGLNEKCLPSAAVLYTPAIGSTTKTTGGREFVLEELASTPLPLRVGKDYTFRVKEVSTTGNSLVKKDAPVLAVGPTLARSFAKVEKGTILKISTATSPQITGATTAISGGPALVHEKKLVYNSSQLRHPRTAIGWNQTHIFFIEVDGRQPALSLGMSYNELGNYMLKLGCEEALNLDGGASATLWILGQVMNSPSAGFDRSVANALVLVQAAREAGAAVATTGAK